MMIDRLCNASHTSQTQTDMHQMMMCFVVKILLYKNLSTVFCLDDFFLLQHTHKSTHILLLFLVEWEHIISDGVGFFLSKCSFAWSKSRIVFQLLVGHDFVLCSRHKSAQPVIDTVQQVTIHKTISRSDFEYEISSVFTSMEN